MWTSSPAPSGTSRRRPTAILRPPVRRISAVLGYPERSGRPVWPARAREIPMPKYVIEREIPGAGKLSPAELQGISQKSCSVLEKLGPQVQWLQSYVTDDKIYCVYIAPNEAAIRE